MQKALLLGLICCALSARAQVFREGQLVRMRGDTLRGEIEDNAWIEAPQQLRFRPEGGPVVTYPAADIRSFRVGGQYFRRETVPLDRAAQTNTNQLTEGLVTHQAPESLLAEVVVDGAARLLYTSVGDVPHYFVQRPGQPFIELAARNYLRHSSEGQLVVADGNNFRAQLLQYFGDCPAVSQLLGAVRFSSPGLAAVVQTYNQQCSSAQQLGTAYLDRPLNKRLAVNLGLTGGARFASAQLHTDDAPGIEAPALQGVNLDGTVHPVGGIFAELVSPGRRVALLLSGLLSSYGRTGSLPAVATGYEGQLDSRYLLLETRIGVRYFWPVGPHSVRLLGGTGLTIPYYLDSCYATAMATSAPYRATAQCPPSM